MQSASHSSSRRFAPVLIRAAATAGLFEASAIAIDAIAVGSASVVESIATGAAIVATQIGVFALLAAPLRRLPVGRALRVAVALWALAVLAGRLWLGEALSVVVILGPLVGVVAIVAGPTARESQESVVAELARHAAIIAIGVGSLQGLLRSPLPEWLVFGAAASLALLGAASLRRSAWLLPAAGAAALGAAWVLPTLLAPPVPKGPNVLWILVDTLRRDHVPPYGDVIQAPALADLAEEGVRFDDAVTVIPKTPASVASLLTGLLPIHHGVRTLYDALPDAPVTAAELFSNAGWRTAAMVQNGWLSARRGFGRGFDRFSGHADLNAGWRLFDRFSWVRFADRLGPRRIPTFDPETDSEVITRAAAARIRAWSDAPFFLYAHYFEAHWPYHPPEASRRRHDAPADTDVNHVPKDGVSRGQMIFANPLPESENEAARRLYRAEVDHTLASVGSLIEQLDDHGLAEDTIVVFTADHGHALGEHAYHFHHGSFLYEPEVLIPLIVRYPREIAGGRVVTQTVRSVDLLPTLLELAGIEAPADLDGRSLVPLLRGELEAPRVAYLESDVKMFAENRRREVPGVAGVIRGLRTDRFKLLLHTTRRGSRVELFDLRADPGETRDLAADPAYASELVTLREALLAHLPPEERAAIGRAGPAETPNADELEQLRALGYVE